MRTEREEKFMDIVLIATCALFGLTSLLSLFLSVYGKANKEVYSTNWSVVEGSAEKATVVKSQLGMEQHHVYHGKGGTYTYSECTSYITIKTEDGKTGTFMRGQENPIAGLSIGNDCTLCIKQYSGDDMFRVADGDTAYFINDVMVYPCTEEELANAFLKDFD